jgi:hypothetical protein
MKKTIFTACSIAIVCCAIIMACTKNDSNTITHVGYASQMGTGGNPNPNQIPATSGYGTTTATTGSTTAGTTSGTTTSTTNTTTTAPYGSMTYSGTAIPSTTVGFVSSTACGQATMTGTSASPAHTLVITFASAPAVGTYTIVSSNPPSTGNASVSFDGTFAQSGTVVVSAATGGKFTATFTNALFGIFSASGSLTCM